MKCNSFRCPNDATVTHDIVQRDGSTLPWRLCPAHDAAYQIELADIEAKNAATEAQWERDAANRERLYGTR